jgi:hypothetical protein
MAATMMSEPACPGDGNEDKKVNGKDIVNWAFFNEHNGLSSWYDFNHDGLTNSADLKMYILPNLGTNCLKKNENGNNNNNGNGNNNDNNNGNGNNNK